MKKNLPVTTQHVDIAPGITLVSKTDLKGIITYANEAFINVSGFALEELQGHSHNIVRHPDMPPAVFEDMWKVLHSGKPWQGLVKNRCKNGDFYWVDACVVPVRRNEQTIGYMSVRKRAEPAAIAHAQALYQQITLNGMTPTWKLPPWLGIRFGMRAGTVFVALLMLAGGALGIGGLKLADAAFARMYHQQFEPAIAVGQIEARLSTIRASVLEAQQERQTDISAAQQAFVHVQQLQNYYDDIADLFSTLNRAMHAESAATQSLTQALQHYTAESHALIATQSKAPKDSTTLPLAVQQELLALEHNASLAAHALRQSLADAAQQEFTQTLERNARIRSFALFGIIAGLLMVAAVGHLFIRGIVNPLNASIRRLNRIAEGDLQGAINLSGTGETAQLNHAATVMQLHLKVMLDEIALAARRIHRHCQTLNAALYEVTEHSEAQHDQVYSAIRTLDAAVSETSDLSTRAERLLALASQQHSTLANETRELATATRLTAFGAEEAADSMRQVAALIVENRGEAQQAWRASEELMHTARELNHLVAFFEPQQHTAPDSAQAT
ncbi:PAS domain-containing methyl-accepting chemotaxis protein [Comamonas aquatica]|uniref:methyl-accepting chemotaxis protein n=1 Tax=Comamonas aquatica TaxID=225991 RepID=UPI00244B4608|nr:PAS domain-containing methyl-accepting chemotaxis protein [Comamonas aquatica]MDH0900650.1 methyl-accepting chemotaxis protein [Comamonas aquatica]